MSGRGDATRGSEAVNKGRRQGHAGVRIRRSRARRERHWRVPAKLVVQTENQSYYGVHKIKTNTLKQETIKELQLCRIKLQKVFDEMLGALHISEKFPKDYHWVGLVYGEDSWS